LDKRFREGGAKRAKMDDFVVSIPKIPAHQQPAIPGAHGWFTNAFVPFGKDEIEQSIPHRFEQMVRKYPTRLAVKTKSQTLT
jgi:hypothetical protein